MELMVAFCRRAVVRNGYLPAREILTTVGPVEVQVPKVIPLPTSPVISADQGLAEPTWQSFRGLPQRAIKYLRRLETATGRRRRGPRVLEGARAGLPGHRASTQLVPQDGQCPHRLAQIPAQQGQGRSPGDLHGGDPHRGQPSLRALHENAIKQNTPRPPRSWRRTARPCWRSSTSRPITGCTCAPPTPRVHATPPYAISPAGPRTARRVRCAPRRAKRRRVVPGRRGRERVAAVARGRESRSRGGNMQSASHTPSSHLRGLSCPADQRGVGYGSDRRASPGKEGCRQGPSPRGSRMLPRGITRDTRHSGNLPRPGLHDG